MKNKEDIIRRTLSIEGWFDGAHAHALFDLAHKYVKKGGEVLEVGSWKGRSSYLLAAVCDYKKAHLTCMDSFIGLVTATPKKPEEGHSRWDIYMTEGGYYREAYTDKDFIRYIKENLKDFPSVSYMKGDSKKLYKKIPDNSLDLCFVDGDHDHPGVDADMKNFWEKVKVGGVFCGHDYETNNDVERALTRLFGDGKVTVQDTVWSIVKK